MLPIEVDRILKNIVSALRTRYAPERIILFGSYATGNAHPDSDIDVLIVKETGARFIDRWKTVRTILSDPSRNLAIETLVMTPQEISDRLARGDQFIADILEHGTLLYAA